MKYILPSEIMRDMGASYWLKDALKSAMQRDPVDALNDAEALASALKYILRSKRCAVCNERIEQGICVYWNDDILPVHSWCR